MNDSVLVDLIKYAKHLEQRIEKTQYDIACLESDPTAEAHTVDDHLSEEECAGLFSCSTSSKAQDESPSPLFKLLE
ncbi:hypothetical protein GOP47_0029484, partial [Adiantum capillus-veneris]